MPKRSSQTRALVDTRGLPEGYDPRKLYEYRIDKLSKDATGLEGLIYKWIPHSVINSVVFAIDPLSRFKVSPGVITPANRTKYRASASVLEQRKLVQGYIAHDVSYQVNYGGSGCIGPYGPATDRSDEFPSALQPQEALPQVLKDTTKKTRLMGSSQGELESFKIVLSSPTRMSSRLDTSSYYFTATPDPSCMFGSYPTQGESRTWSFDRVEGPGATLSKITYDALKANEIFLATSLMQKNAISLVKDLSMGKRDYTLFRNLAELRDLPGSVQSLYETCKNLRSLYTSLTFNPKLRDVIFDLKANVKNVPNEYLSYHFGWKQLYKDINDLLAAPQKLSSRLNFQIERSGKPTTLRTKRKYVSGESDVSAFDYAFWTRWDFEPRGIQSRIEREIELRVVINTTFDFPPINSVRFRYDYYIENLGIKPRITDVYNLVPWTWLLDWFTGLGNYIELIDNLNHDTNFINWGLISSVTTGKMITDLRSTGMDHTRRQVDTSVNENETQRSYAHSSVCEYSLHLRKDLSTILDVNMAVDPSTLSTYQLSIIGALLTQRTNFGRTGPK